MTHMTKNARFTVEVTDKDRFEFANLSGDFNPLHIDDDYVESTGFKKVYSMERLVQESFREWRECICQGLNDCYTV